MNLRENGLNSKVTSKDGLERRYWAAQLRLNTENTKDQMQPFAVVKMAAK